MRIIKKHFLLAFFLVTVVAACTDSKQYETSFCTLVDISGTYAGEKGSCIGVAITRRGER